MPISDEDLAGFDNVVALPRAAAGAIAKPEPAGQAVQLAQTSGFPASIIGADLESYQQIDKGQKAAAAIERNQWISGYVARNPEAAEVSNDDYDNLDRLSQSVTGLDTHSAFKRAWDAFGEAAPYLAAAESGGTLPKVVEAAGSGFKQGFGEQPVGFSFENRLKLPITTLVWQPFVAPIDTFFRLPGGIIGAGSASIAELYRQAGGSEADANRLDRDLRIIGMGALIESVMGRMEAGTPKGKPGTGGYVSVDDFLATVRGMQTRAEIDSFLAKRDGGPNDVLRITFQKERTIADSAKLDEAVQSVAETNTKTRAPTLIEDFIKGHETGTLSIPAQTIADVYRAEGKTPQAGDGLFGFVPDLPAKLVTGAETGTEIDVPVAKYLAHVDPAVHEKVKESIRFSNDGLTLGEAKETEPAKIGPQVPESVLSVFPDIPVTNEGAVSLNPFTTEERTALRNAGLVEKFKTAEGVEYEGVSTEKLWQLRKQAQEARRRPKPIEAFHGSPLTILERNGQALRAAAQAEVEDLGLRPLFDQIIAEKTKGKEPASTTENDLKGAPKALFSEPPPGMTKADFDRYNKKIAAIQQSILESATKITEATKDARLTKEWKEQEAEVRKEQEAIIAARPDIAAERYIKKGNVKLDEAVVKEMLGDDTDALPSIMKAKGGAHPDDIAPYNGFSSGKRMIRALNELALDRKATGESPTKQFNRLVDEATATQMETQYGDFGRQIAEEARALALDDLHFDILADELRALGGQPIDKAAIKALVMEHFARLDSKTAANFEKFQKTAGRNGLLAERALLKGDTTEAFRAKQVQAMQFLLAKEAERFGRLVDRTAKKIDRVTKKDSIASMDQEHFDQLKRVLGELGFDLRGSEPNPATSLGDFVAQSDGQLAVAAWLTDGTLLPRDPSALTVQQFQDLSKTIDSMMHVGRQAKMLDSARGKAEKENIVRDIVKSLERFDFIEHPLNPTIPQRILSGPKTVARYITAWNLLVERMLDYTDKFDPNGPLSLYLDRPLREAYSHELELQERTIAQLRDLQEKYVDNSILDMIPNNVISTKRMANSLLDMNRANLRQLMGYMGSESGIKKVTQGFGVDEADVWKLINDNAIKADWQWVAGMHEVFQRLWKDAAAMQERVTGVVADEIVPKKMISEKYGEFPGGYWPVKYDIFDSNLAGHLLMKGDLFDAHYPQAVTPQAYTQPRTGYADALDLTGDRIKTHLQGIIHDIAFREAVLNAKKLISDDDFRTAMKQRWGAANADLLDGWLKDIANAHTQDDSMSLGLARVLSLTRQNMVSTLIAWNPGTVIKHGGTAIGLSVSSVGAKDFGGALWEVGLRGMVSAAKDIALGGKRISLPEELHDAVKAVTDPGKYGEGVRQFILDSSPLMRNRQKQAMDSLYEAWQDNLKTGIGRQLMDIRGAVIDFNRVPIAVSDALSAFPTWLSAYRETMLKTGDHEQAVYEADRQVTRSHGSNFIGDRPASMRLGGNSALGQLWKFVTPLYGFFNHAFNIALQIAWDTGARWKGANEPGANIKSLSNRFFWTIIFGITMEELAAPALNEDRRGGVLYTHAVLPVVRFFGGMLPVVREFSNGFASGYEPSVGFLSTLFRNIKDTAKDVAIKPSQNWMMHFSQAMGFATGAVPGGAQAGRTGSYIKDRLTGRERPPRTWGELRQGLRTGHSKPRIMR